MDNSALFNKLIKKLRTKTEVSQVLVCLEAFVASYSTLKSKEEQKMVFENLPKQIADILSVELTNESTSPENQIKINRKIVLLSQSLRSCKTVQLTLAFQPNESTIALYSDWMKKNVDPDTILDLQFDKTIVGGALIIANGVFKDYSVHKNLSNRFQIQRDELLGLLK